MHSGRHFQAVEQKHLTLFVLFEASETFDTVDHGILLKCLQKSFGGMGHALSWLNLYLSRHTQAVVFDSTLSDWSGCQLVFYRGSTLEPLVSILHTADLCQVFFPFFYLFEVMAHQYAYR